MPYLFEQWGPVMAVVAGLFWFGLLFFAGITSSLAMGTPVMGFLQDEYGWKRQPAAWAFGGIVFLLGLPTVLFFNEGVFDEYDYWAGTVSLVVFALLEIILFAWVFGMDKGWREITDGSDIKVPKIFKFIIKFITPVLLGYVFIMSCPGIWDKIMNVDIYKAISETTDQATIALLEKKLLYVNISRAGLLLLWLGIAYLVYHAYKKRIKEGRFTS
jgi:NSS family neurotransmitter:Na+ symporter